MPSHSRTRSWMQARRAAGCNMRYLGALPDCNAISTALFAFSHPTALLKWELIRV